MSMRIRDRELGEMLLTILYDRNTVILDCRLAHLHAGPPGT